MKVKRKYKYDIAISFAEEDRNIALAVRSTFKLNELRRVRVYYYADKPEETWGYNLRERLPKLYRDESRYALIILSEKYPNKKYCQIELEAIRQRMQKESDRYLFILTTDDTEPSAIELDNDYAFRRWNYDPENLARIINKILGSPKIAFRRTRKMSLTFTVTLVGFVASILTIIEVIDLANPFRIVDVEPIDTLIQTNDTIPDPGLGPPLLLRELTASAQPDLSLLVMDDTYKIQNSLASSVSQILGKKGVKVHMGLLNPEVVNAEVIDELRGFNTASISGFNPEDELDYIMIGILRFSMSKDDLDSYVVSAAIELSVSDLHQLSASRTLHFYGSGTHDGKQAAKSLALQSLINKMAYSLGYSFRNYHDQL